MSDSIGRGLLLLVCCVFLETPASAAGDIALPERYRNWLAEVKLILTAEERQAFLALSEDHRRDAFIEAFWRARDPDPATPLNPFRETYYGRREEARARFGAYDNDPAVVWILNGPPAEVYAAECNLAVWPLEIWSYRSSDQVPHAFSLLFYRPSGAKLLRLWQPTEGYAVLQAFPTEDELDAGRAGLGRPESSAGGDSFWRFYRYLRRYCLGHDEAARIIAAVRQLKSEGRGALSAAQSPPVPDPEWLATFADRSTDASTSDPLSAAHRRWLEEVALLITPEERRTFLALPREHQREGFIAEFWKIRDPDPRTEANELRSLFAARQETARQRFGTLIHDQARIYVLNGEPAAKVGTDCNQNLWPLEIWQYAYSDRSRRPFTLLFYRPPPGSGPYRLWHASDGYHVLARRPLNQGPRNPRPGAGEYEGFYRMLRDGTPAEPPWCPADADAIILAMRRLETIDLMIAEIADQPPPVDPEWLSGYRSFSTELTPGGPLLAAELTIDYPARHQSRTVVRGTLLVPPDPAAAGAARAFTLTGEVLREATLHESFRYVYQLSPAEVGEGALPLTFERALRPGTFRLVLKLEDNRSRRALRLERELEVPALAASTDEGGGGADPAPPLAAFRLLAPAADLVSGVLRVQAEVGDPRVRQVAFALDGKPLLVRQRPPWTVELRLGELPRSVRVRAVARDGAGAVLAADELLLNGAPHRFTVRLVEPRDGDAGTTLRVRAEVHAPAGRAVDRLELFLDQSPLATLYQPPWELVVPRLPQPAATFLRAVAHLPDGSTAEDVVLLSGGEGQRGRVEVDLVEVYTTVLGPDGHPAEGLQAGDFTVREDGRPQRVTRFQHVTELPLHVALLVDTSASMADALPKVEAAAIDFFRTTLAPGDRAAVYTFSEEPRLAAPFTGDLTALTAAMVGLRAERGTALWDSLVHALHYFQGIGGRRALLVFSDGADRGSRFRFDEALAYAQHAGVAIYTVSFGSPGSGMLEGRRRLARLAEETGGRAFTLTDVVELPATYATIERDLRSQYLLVYQSTAEGPGFRGIEVSVQRPGMTARAMRGYIP